VVVLSPGYQGASRRAGRGGGGGAARGRFKPPLKFRNFDTVPKIKKILLYQMKFLVPNYSCLQNPWLGGHCPQIPVLSVLNWICWTPQTPPPPPRYATDSENLKFHVYNTASHQTTQWIHNMLHKTSLHCTALLICLPAACPCILQLQDNAISFSFSNCAMFKSWTPDTGALWRDYSPAQCKPVYPFPSTCAARPGAWNTPWHSLCFGRLNCSGQHYL
jgi:hypothetical protein